MNFECIHQTSKRTQKWEGSVNLIKQDDKYIEATITGRGSYFHVIIGPHMYGNFICIPNYEIGSELAAYDDIFWNRERLKRSMGVVDATTIATGLKHIKELIN